MDDQSLTEVHKTEAVTVIALTSRCELIEDALLDPLGRELSQTIQSAEPPRIVLDLSRSRFFGSGFIELLLRQWRGVQSKPDVKLVLCGVQQYCREVLEITHLDQLWPIALTREEAIQTATE